MIFFSRIPIARTVVILLGVLIFFCSIRASVHESSVLRFVDPRIGTAGHGHTFMGVSVPFGAVQLGPANINKGWDWCSAYHYSDSVVIGFSHLHLSGTGCSDTGDILFMPYTGELKTYRGTQQNPDSGYASRYSHTAEISTPAYYSLMLQDYDITVELTATERVGFHRYTFPVEVQKHININLHEANGDDRPTEAFMEQVDSHTICGYRFSTGWSKRQQVYFTAVFSEPVTLSLYRGDTLVEGKSLLGLDVKGNISLQGDNSRLMVKVGISPVSTQNATLNIEKELPGWNFDKTVECTSAKWEQELTKVKIESDDDDAKHIFYTALYHAFLQPNLMNDVNGDYCGSDIERTVHPTATFENYTVFSLWDTYRAAHPLYTILQAERVPDMVNSMLAIYREQGILPVWHLYGSDTWEMIGIQSVPVIADAILKGVEDFDVLQAYEAMKSSMLSDYKGLSYLKQGDYIPADKEGESVAKGLEYAIADGAIARVAQKMGKREDYELFSSRAARYRQYWDPATHFFRGKTAEGKWKEPFSPFLSAHRSDDYCEGTGWQYTWLVPHHVQGLIDLFGSKEAFIAKLDSLFIINADMGERASGDISGLIGQYAHGNEPGHHTVYLYPFAGQQWKTAQKVRYIVDNMYRNDPDGLEGNEDCGQMSSWYVFSSLGFYPVNPFNGVYVFGSPRFDKATISLPEGKKFTIKALNNSAENIYIQSVTLNKKPYTKTYIRHIDIMQGGTLVFNMGPSPAPLFGAESADYPPDV